MLYGGIKIEHFNFGIGLCNALTMIFIVRVIGLQLVYSTKEMQQKVFSDHGLPNGRQKFLKGIKRPRSS